MYNLKSLDNIKHSVTAVILNKSGEVLCVSRKDDHLDFGLPGGKVDEEDISFESAIYREVMEETGIKIDIDSMIQIVSMHKDNMYLGHTYLVREWCGDINTEEPHVVKWSTFDELERGCFAYWNNLVRLSLNSMGIFI